MGISRANISNATPTQGTIYNQQQGLGGGVGDCTSATFTLASSTDNTVTNSSATNSAS